MAMQPVVKPQETKPAPLPAYPVAPSSQTQTSSRGMVPPKAYAGVPKSVPHYDAGTDSVQPLPQPAPSSTSAHGPVHLSVPFVPPAPPTPVARGPNGRVLYAPITASTLMANAPSALAHAAFGAPGLTPMPQHPASAMGTPILNANPGTIGSPTGAPFQGTVAHGGDNSLTPDPTGQYDVGLVGQPYASTPAQAVTAATNTGVNPIALQNAAGAARDAIGNPSAHTPQTFAGATRGLTWRQLQALGPMMHYDPKMALFNSMVGKQAQQAAGMPNPGERQKAYDTIVQETQAITGSMPGMKTYIPQTQYDENGLPIPVQ